MSSARQTDANSFWGSNVFLEAFWVSPLSGLNGPPRYTSAVDSMVIIIGE